MQAPPPRIELVVLDWAGTAVDHGSLAPVGVFLELFRRRGVDVTLAEGREPMGVHKREHIRRMTEMPTVRAKWTEANGKPPTDADIDAMYAEATPIQKACLPDYGDPIPGVPPMVERLRARGIRVAGTTGYNREMLDVLEPVAASKGYAPDLAIPASEAAAGRPAPYLCWRAAETLGASSHWQCVKAGDTVVDMESGRNAGFWTVGIAATGNLVGLNLQDYEALDEAERTERVVKARAMLTAAGAHYVIDSAATLDQVVDDIEARLARGERP